MIIYKIFLAKYAYNLISIKYQCQFLLKIGFNTNLISVFSGENPYSNNSKGFKPSLNEKHHSLPMPLILINFAGIFSPNTPSSYNQLILLSICSQSNANVVINDTFDNTSNNSFPVKIIFFH